MMYTFPGFIDAHVHLRDPGATHKEDFTTGSRAAIKGGFTRVLDMPNNPLPTFSMTRLRDKIRRTRNLPCDIGFHYGTKGDNLASFPAAWRNPHIFGLKLYCNHTTGDFLIEDLSLLEGVFAAWKSEKPILVHAEGVHLAATLALATVYDRRLHICHISQASEVVLVRQAKKKKLRVTSGVTPHHLFLTNTSSELMKPPLGTKKDQDALWEGIADGTIDIVETDHAPHTMKEKQSDKPPFGVPGLETAAGLMFLGVKKKKLRQKDVVKLLYHNPKKIFHIPIQPKTTVALDPDKSYIVGKDGYQTKSGWSPFNGWELYGEVQDVIVRGRYVVRYHQIV